MRRKLIVLLILVVIGVSSGLALTAIGNRSQNPTEIDFANPPSNVTVVQDVSVAAYTREEMIDGADIIFVGKVLSISPTFYNQDSGEYWYDEAYGVGLQLHTIEFEVLRPIVDTLGMESQVTVYIFGASPVDGGTTEGEYTIVQAGGDYEMKVGDQVLLFAGQVPEFSWREGGTRNLLMGDPGLGAFVQMPDRTYHDPWNNESISLDVLIGEIAGRRTTLVQP